MQSCRREHHAVSRFQILDRAGAAQVEEIDSRAQVAGSPSLLLADVGEAMLHHDAFRQTTTPRGAGHQLPKPMLERLIYQW